MTTETEIPVEDSILGVLRGLGIERAHFASRGLNDWHGVVSRYPEAAASLTLVCPLGFDSQVLAPLSERLLVFNGDSGGASQTISGLSARFPTTTTTWPRSGAARLQRRCSVSLRGPTPGLCRDS